MIDVTLERDDRVRLGQRYAPGSQQYKAQKELFVQGFSGTTVGEVSTLCAIVTLSVIVQCLIYRLLTSITDRSRISEAQSIIVDLVIYFINFMSIPIVVLFAMVYPEYHQKLLIGQITMISIGCSIQWLYQPAGQMLVQSSPPDQYVRLRSVSFLRSSFMLCTITAILAVDFPIFPRRYVKTERFGTSLMDTGVGFVVFASGLVSRQSRSAEKSLKRTVIGTMPMLLMGVLRLATLRAVNYQEHTSEYGLHWNFFITLAAVSILSHLLGPLLDRISPALLATSLAVLYQFALTYYGVADYVFNAPRTNLLSANREGLFSLFGYESIYLFGLATGQCLQRYRSNLGKIAFIMGSLSVTIFSVISSESISRRLANLQFVMWIIALDFAILSVLIAFDTILIWPSADEGESPLLAAITRNQLFVFIGSNLITGFVNLTTQTIYATDRIANMIMIAYLFTVCGIAYIADQLGITFKFW